MNDSPLDPETAVRLISALENGHLDYLFQTAHIDYSERDGLAGTSHSLGLPRDAVVRLLSTVRRAQGLTILAGAWGDFSGWITLSAEMIELLHEIDTRSQFDFYSNSQMPEDEIRHLQHKLLIEEVLPLGLTIGELSPLNELELRKARNGARRMLMEGLEPTTDYERWVLRFFELMRRLPELAEEPLTVGRMLDLHTQIVLDKRDGGRYRTTALITNPGLGLSADGQSTPPERIAAEMDAVASYCTGSQKPFVHPLIKTLVHFYWIRRVQPFSVANGLFARLIAHIYEFQQGYHYLPLSPLTRTASSEWAVPPPDAPESTFDATEFIIKRLRLFLDAYMEAEREIDEASRHFKALCDKFAPLNVNHRQARILDEALSVPTTVFTIRRHARSRGLAYETARQDFLQLVNAGYMEQQRRGRVFEFRLAQDGERRLVSKLG